MLYTTILQTIGNTPLIRLARIGRERKGIEFYTKYEAANPGGSIKDRIGLSMIEAAEVQGLLKPGGTIVEATAGNTGVGLALIAAMKGYRCLFVLPDKMSEDKINLLKAFGAEVVITPTAVSPDSPEYYNNVAERLAREIPGAFRPNQFANLTNPQAHYQTTGPEIWKDTGGRVDVFVAGVGTGGTISGVGQFLKEQKPSVKIVAADPEGSIISGVPEGGTKPWLVEGIGEDFIPLTYDRPVVDDIIRIADRESFSMARRLAREEGIFVGGSSGTAMAAALKYAERMEKGVVVALLPDTGRNYLTKLFNDQWMQEHGFLNYSLERISIGTVLRRRPNWDRIISVSADAEAMEAVRLMHKHNISQVPVMEGSGLVGSMSEELIMKLVHDAVRLEGRKVSAVMGKPLPLLDSSVDANEAYRLLLSGNSAIVVAEGGLPKGMLTKLDLVDYWVRQKGT